MPFFLQITVSNVLYYVSFVHNYREEVRKISS